MKNREGQKIELSEIEKVRDIDSGFEVTQKGGWTLFIGKDECGDFTPRDGDWMLVSYHGFNTIAGIIIEGRVIRAKTTKQIEDDHEQWMKNLRLRRLERYIKHGDALKADAAALATPLRERMERFVAEAENPVDFWIEDAGYELACLKGADALLRKVAALGLDTPEEAIKWIEDWWDINSDKHDPPYDYKKQMEIVPDFGDGHSGFTASAAKGLAVLVLKGEKV